MDDTMTMQFKDKPSFKEFRQNYDKSDNYENFKFNYELIDENLDDDQLNSKLSDQNRYEDGKINLNQLNFELTGWEVQIYSDLVEEFDELNELNDYFSQIRFNDNLEEQEFNFDLERYDENDVNDDDLKSNLNDDFIEDFNYYTHHQFVNKNQESRHELLKKDKADYQLMNYCFNNDHLINDYSKNLRLQNNEIDDQLLNDGKPNDYLINGLEIVAYESETTNAEFLNHDDSNSDYHNLNFLKENYPCDLNYELNDDFNPSKSFQTKKRKAKRVKKVKRTNIRTLLDGDDLTKIDFNQEKPQSIDLDDNELDSFHKINFETYEFQDLFTCLPDALFEEF